MTACLKVAAASRNCWKMMVKYVLHMLISGKRKVVSTWSVMVWCYLSLSLGVDVFYFTTGFVRFGAVLKIMGPRVMGIDQLRYFF